MQDLQIILNPLAGRGYAVRVRDDLARNLDALGVNHAFHLTEGPGHAIDLARDLVDAGQHRLASAGGDGTAHEVVNGIMMASNGSGPVTLACIPAGSGNDFALMNGLSADIKEACGAIAEGHTRLIDLGLISLDNGLTRYFDNTVGIGFDGLVAAGTRKAKYLRGLALYIPVVLKTIFITMQTPQSELIVDGESSQIAPMMVTVCNGPREGGGFMLAPDARFDDGQLDLVITDRMSRLQMLAMVPRFLKGTHLSHPAVSLRTCTDLVMRSADPLYVHVDGEILAEHSHEIHLKIVPQSLLLVAPSLKPTRSA